jgi:tetratricopeptide (TPR) repeat protein
MARKRINYKVLGGVLGGIVVAGGLVLLAGKTLTHESPTSYAELGDVYMTEHKWPDAIKAYSMAVRLTKATNADYLTRRGRAIRMETPFEPDLIGKDRADWDKALEIDPRYMPALSMELNFWVEAAPLDGSAGSYAKVRDLAERIEALDPTQLHAAAYGPISVIQSWLGQVQQSDAAIDQAIDKLTSILAKETAAAASQPAVATAKPYQINPEVPYYITLARYKRAYLALRAGKAPLAQDNVDQAVALFDKLLKEQDQNPGLAYRAYSAYTQLARVDRTNSAADTEKAQTALDRARALVDEKDPLLVEINMAASEALFNRGDPAGSIQLLRDVLATHPNNAQITLLLARRLSADPAKRKEAIDLLNSLSNSKIAGEGNEGIRGLTMSGMRTAVTIELTNLRMQEYGALKDPQARADILKEIEASVTKLQSVNGESGPILRLVGQLQLLKGQNVEAIQTFSRAAQLMERSQNIRDRAEIRFQLARAYMQASQTGPARDTLKQLITEMPNIIPPRVMLAQVCLQDGDRDGAQSQYNQLKQMAPDNQEVIRLGLMLMDPTKQKERVEEEFAKLPETTRQEKFYKVQAAIAVNRTEDAAKLLQSLHDADAADTDAARFLARIYNQLGDKPRAIKIVNETLQAVPNDPQMKLLAAALSKGSLSEAEFDKEQLDAINSMPNDRDRELTLSQYYLDRANRDEALVHLKKAEAAHPDDGEVIDRLFQFYVAGKQWDDAQRYLPKLAAMNRDQANGKLFLFRFQLYKGDYQAALETARDVTRTLPEFAQAWLVYGQALQSIGQFEQARAQYIQALAKQSNNMDALKGVITCDYKLGKPDDAKRYISSGREYYPNDPTFKELDASWEMNYGDPEKVIPLREAALKQFPNRAESYGELGVVYMRSGLVRRQAGPEGADAAKSLYAKAWDIFTQGKNKWPDNKIFYAYIAELALTGNGDLSAADKALTELTTRDAYKGKPDPFDLLGDFYLRAGKFDQAEAAMKQAVALAAKEDMTPRLQYVSFLEQRRRYDDALAALDPISNMPGIISRRVEILLHASRYPAAETLMLGALKDHPTDVSLMDLMATTYVQMGRYDQAAEWVGKALQLAPNDLMAVYSRGLINLRSPRPDIAAAVRDLTAVRNASPTTLDARQALAEALRRNRDNDGAIRELETCLSMAPQNPSIREQLVQWYLAATPPRYNDADRVIHEAETNPQLSRDPRWFELEASAWIARGNNDKTVAAARKFVDASPGNPRAARLYASALSDARQYQAVLDYTDKLIGTKQEAWWTHQLRGIARRNLTSKDAAMTEFDAALRLAREAKDDEGSAAVVRTIASEIGVDDAIKIISDRAKTDPRWKLLTAVLYQTKGDLPSALAAVEGALADPSMTPGDRANALRIAGSIYLSPPKPDYEKGITAYTKVLEVAKDDVASMNNLACALLEVGRPQDALKYSQQAYSIITAAGIREPLVYDTHGWALIQTGRVGEGLNLLAQAADLRSFFDVHYHLAEGYLMSKPPLATESAREFKIASDLLAQSAVQDPAVKAKVDAGLAKANELIKEQQKPISQSSTPVSPAVP